MNQVTRILKAIESGEGAASRELFPLVYDELRRLANAKLAQERSDHTLQATALVHEAYLRLMGPGEEFQWSSRGHFFGAAAEAMRRILIDAARQKKAIKRGGQGQKVEFDSFEHPALENSERVLALSEALDQLEIHDPVKAQLVKLRFFAGLTNRQVAAAMEISDSTADRYWAYAKAWLQVQMKE